MVSAREAIMVVDPIGARLSELLSAWWSRYDQGDPISAAALCAQWGCPELSGELNRRIAAVHQVEGLMSGTRPRGPFAPEPNLAPGAEPVAGYRLFERLGKGGFGEVWRAEGPGSVQVALKFIVLAVGTGAIEQRALEVIKNIRHPHLLAISGAWQVGGYLIVAMELAERTLLDRLRRPPARAISASRPPRSTNTFSTRPGGSTS
jgi:hypothetical protein